MDRSWQKERGKRTDYINIYDGKVEIGHHYGNGHTDCATSVSFAEFLQGSWQKEIREIHGEELLAEIITEVRSRLESPAAPVSRE